MSDFQHFFWRWSSICFRVVFGFDAAETERPSAFWLEIRSPFVERRRHAQGEFSKGEFSSSTPQDRTANWKIARTAKMDLTKGAIQSRSDFRPQEDWDFNTSPWEVEETKITRIEVFEKILRKRWIASRWRAGRRFKAYEAEGTNPQYQRQNSSSSGSEVSASGCRRGLVRHRATFSYVSFLRSLMAAWRNLTSCFWKVARGK